MMFNNTLVRIYASSDSGSYIKSIYADFQPFSKSITFGDNFQIDITNRIFCDIFNAIDIESYVEVENEKYKVMNIKKWDDYLEILLYKLKRQV